MAKAQISRAEAQRRRDGRGFSLYIVHSSGDPVSRQAFAGIQQILDSLYLRVSARELFLLFVLFLLFALFVVKRAGFRVEDQGDR
jgi:hypothetical protein